MKTILVIDDDISIGNMLEETLTKAGYAVKRAYSGTEALLLLEHSRPDLVLLDLMLPGMSGEEVLPALSGIPVIVISAKADPDDKVELLLGGAADYVTKPFDRKELLARIAVQFRQSPAGSQESLQYGDLTLVTDRRCVLVNDREIKLTPTECAVLRLLLAAPAAVLTRSKILESLDDDFIDGTESSLKTHISHLRKKLREAGSQEDIEAVWGIGYKMKGV